MNILYGGTKAEMERLIADASKMTEIQKKLGITVDESSMSFDNVINAISVVQSKLGIANTSLEEGSKTVEGSVNTMRAAWDNLITGMGDKNADVSALTDQFVDTIVGGTDEAGNHVNGMLDNVMPVAMSALSGIGTLIGGLSESLSTELPTMLTTLIPEAGKALTDLLIAAVKALPKAIPAILEALKIAAKEILEALPEILDTIIEFFDNNIDDIVVTIVDIFMTIMEALYQSDIMSKIMEASFKLMEGLADGLLEAIPVIIAALPKIIEGFIKFLLGSIPKIAEHGVKLIVSLVSHLPEIIQGIVVAIPQIIGAILSAFLPIGEKLGDLFAGAVEGIQQAFSGIGDFFAGVWNGIQNAFSSVGEWFKDTFSKAWEGIKNVFSTTGQMFGNIGKSILNGLSSVINGIIWGINQVIKIPLDGLNGILRAIHDIDIFGLKPFDWIGQIPVPQIPSIPMLAEGGVLKRGQVALLEGQGDEAVIPLSQNTEWIDMVANRLNSRSGEEQPQNVYYTINLDVASLNANSREDIEQLADILLDVMAQKTARRKAAF